MSTKMTKNELIALNAQLAEKVAALGTALADKNAELTALRAKMPSAPHASKIAAAQHLAEMRDKAQALVAQYGARNVRRVGGKFEVLTPNGAWQTVLSA